MLDLLTFGFMQRALTASLIIGVLCSIIGVFVVLRGLSFIGAGTSHAAFAGVTFGYLAGWRSCSGSARSGSSTACTSAGS